MMVVVAAIFLYAFLQLILLIPFGLIICGVMFLARYRSRYTRATIFVVCVTLLCTPAWGPATIAMAPVPFGLIFGVAATSFHWHALLDIMGMAPLHWYFVAFPATAIVAYALWWFVFSNCSFKRTREKPRAT
jgi:hypothetical protein